MTDSLHEISGRLAAAGVARNVVASWKQLRPWAFRADLWRLMVLWDVGGVYMDAKVRLNASVDQWLSFEVDDIAVCIDSAATPAPRGGFVYWNGMVAAQPKSAVLADAIKKMVSNINSHFYGPGLRVVLPELYITGPGMLTDVIHESNVGMRNDCFWNHSAPYAPFQLFMKDSNAAIGEVNEAVHHMMNGGVYHLYWRNHSVYCDEPGHPCFDQAGPSHTPNLSSPWQWSNGIPNLMFFVSAQSPAPQHHWERAKHLMPRGTKIIEVAVGDNAEPWVRIISGQLQKYSIVDGAFDAWSSLQAGQLRIDLCRFMLLWAHGGLVLGTQLSLSARLDHLNLSVSGLSLFQDSAPAETYSTQFLLAEPLNEDVAYITFLLVVRIKTGNPSLPATGSDAVEHALGSQRYGYGRTRNILGKVYTNGSVLVSEPYVRMGLQSFDGLAV